ncbi:heme ABC exporter, ATP-binding protein CcmA [Pseudofulvimonas gallinarii]|jgi:heme exporter protein A|uniref:Heme exporter protein A n=1 Tax=Pseudofulvimonas gallinarii TaxID=634155 RepID=A0A4S3L121_9GAMM|nr:heme ABC exporter ATP-binding protein CcmA [Pseudofulvimonas gallinarii]TCS99645.1 heme exporter protein A [Pseudofulvimonas gallinarii]THD15316.1 heme ABC exporter, ATP-binding protein CcmA [Pseudofulvimonas gallinarii]
MAGLNSELPPLLVTRGLAFGYDEHGMFRDLDLCLRPGTGLVLCGSNGSGKSTLLRLLAGLLLPDSGSIERAIEHTTGEPVALAWHGHHLGLKTGLSVIENLRWSGGMHERRRRMTPASALETVGLDGFEHVPTRELSAGQRKRVALARLLLSPAPLWLLDEPYANLDPRGAQLVDRLIGHHLRNGGSVVLSVHRPDQAAFEGPRQLLDLDALP